MQIEVCKVVSEYDLLILTKPPDGLETVIADVHSVASELSRPRQIALGVKNGSEEIVGELCVVLVMLSGKYTHDAVCFVGRCAHDVCESQFFDVCYGLSQKLGIAGNDEGLSVICYRLAFYFFDRAMVRLQSPDFLLIFFA